MSDYRVRIEHRTTYRYESSVRNSKNELRMTPQPTPWQTLVTIGLDVTPEPSHRASYRDYFGTVVEYLEVLEPHDVLDVLATSEVDLTSRASEDFPSPDRDRAVEYLPRSPMVTWDQDVRDIAASLRTNDAEETVRAVASWLHDEMSYEQGTTVVGTPVTEVLANRRGVCQDYAHLACAILRMSDIPTRYVSGYFAPVELEPGASVAAESHAWIEALLPNGWLPIDPTNGIRCNWRHIKVGHGRDYSDVVPFTGVHHGISDQTLTVEVQITRLA